MRISWLKAKQQRAKRVLEIEVVAPRICSVWGNGDLSKRIPKNSGALVSRSRRLLSHWEDLKSCGISTRRTRFAQRIASYLLLGLSSTSSSSMPWPTEEFSRQDLSWKRLFSLLSL